MKKMFKKSIAMLIAVLMVISAMPFTAITASAAEGVFTNNGFTLVYNSGQDRWENNSQFNIVNDQQAGNTSVGIIRYDISSLQGKNLDYAKLNFSVDEWLGDGKGLVFYYSNILKGTNLNNGSHADSDLAYGSGTYANTQAASKFGFDTGNQLTNVTKGDKSVKTVDISNAVKSVLASNSREFYIYIMQQTAGGDGGNKLDDSCESGWTDTKIKPANVTITYSTSVKTNYTFDEMVTALNNFTPYSPNAHGTFSGDDSYTNYEDHYKGLVYAKPVTTYSATGNTKIDSGFTGSNSTYANLYLPTAVALYTGKDNDEITVPVMISASVSRSGTWATKYIAHSGVISGNDLSLAMSQWNGKDETAEASENTYTNGNQVNNIPRLNFMWTVNQTNYRLTTNSTTTPTANEIDTVYGKKAALWANKIKVSPNFSNNSTSTVKTYNPTVTFYTTVNSNKNIDTSKGINLASTDSITVVNYKPYLDKINIAKQDIKDMNNIGSAHYEAESLKAYVDACVNLINIDPSDYTKYTYSSAAPNAAQTLANDINSALTAYDNAKAGLKFNYTFVSAENKSTVVAAKNEAEALANKPNNTPTTKKTLADDQAKHKWIEYTWPASATDYKFVEVSNDKFENHNYGAETSAIETPATCGTKGTMKYTKTCTDCGYESVRTEDIPATGAHDCVYTKKDASVHTVTCKNCDYSVEEAHDIVGGKCSKCGYIALDLDTYKAAITEADGIIANSDGKYTADSVTAYKAAVDTAKAKTYSTQKEIDAIVSEIQSAKTLLQKARVTITFVVQKEDGIPTVTDIPADWGNPVHLDTQSNYVSKWTITVNDVTSKIDSNASAIYHVATENATITAYVSNDETENVKYSKVTFLGKNSAVVGIKYVAVGTTVETNTLLTAPAIPFYEEGQWDKAEIKADGSDITVRATYVPKAGDEKKCGIHFNGETKYYNYDSYVYLFNADKSKKYAMYASEEDTQPITYFDGVDFYAPRRDNLYIKEVTATSAMTQGTIGFTGFYKQDATSSFNVKFWLPEGATLIETGVDLVAKYPDGKVKSAHDRATKFSERNEYTYTGKFGTSKKTIEFKPYLTYMKDGVKTTVYGTSQTVEFN